MDALCDEKCPSNSLPKFLRFLAESLEQKKTKDEQLRLMSDFLCKKSDKEFLKYLFIGWYVCRFMSV